MPTEAPSTSLFQHAQAQVLHEALRNDEYRVLAKLLDDQVFLPNDKLFSLNFRASNSFDGNASLNLDNSCTALHLASSFNSRQCVKELLKRGADVSIRDGLHRLPYELTTSKRIMALLDKAAKLRDRKSNLHEEAHKSYKRSKTRLRKLTRHHTAGDIVELDNIKSTLSVQLDDISRDIEGLRHEMRIQEGRLERSLHRKAQFIYANLEAKNDGNGEENDINSIYSSVHDVKDSMKAMEKRLHKLETELKKHKDDFQHLAAPKLYEKIERNIRRISYLEELAQHKGSNGCCTIM